MKIVANGIDIDLELRNYICCYRHIHVYEMIIVFIEVKFLPLAQICKWELFGLVRI